MTNEKEIIEFWKDNVYTKGKIDEKKVMNELIDYYFLIKEVPKVYCEITGGLLSKLNYPAEIVLSEFNERFWDKEIIIDDIKKMIKDTKTLKELKKELDNYLV